MLATKSVLSFICGKSRLCNIPVFVVVFLELSYDSEVMRQIWVSVISNHAILVCHQQLRLLAEESGDKSSDVAEKELALTNGIDAVSSKMEMSVAEYNSKKEKQLEYENACKEKIATPDPEAIQESKSKEENKPDNSKKEIDVAKQEVRQSIIESDSKSVEEAAMLSNQRKMTVLYELLSACLANIPEESTKRRKGYDARHRVALRLLATWFDIKWIKMV